METSEVSVRRFRRFVEESDHITDAEGPQPREEIADLELELRLPEGADGMLAPGGLVFDRDDGTRAGGWRWAQGASWRYPAGEAGPQAADHEPVRQVSLRDALAFAQWAGLRLPTEAEWERAARGPQGDWEHPWGDEDHQRLAPRANLWNGPFPGIDRARDGYRGVAPLRSFPPSPGLRIHDLAGNVWEWCADAWTQSYAARAGRGLDETPSSRAPIGAGARGVIKGGSHLSPEAGDHPDSRAAARRPWPATLGRPDLGFRCVLDVAMRWPQAQP